MHRDDKSQYMLFIEPPVSEKQYNPEMEQTAKILEKALESATQGYSKYDNLADQGKFTQSAGYRGFHRTACGERSTNRDYFIKDCELITNSLAPFYVRYYSKSIQPNDWEKINKVVEAYKHKL